MQTARVLQAVALMLVVAATAGCAASKQYTSKLFALRNAPEKPVDSTAVALRFLDIDTAESDKANWVSTDIITGRDTSNSTTTLDNFSKSFPANPTPKKDSLATPKDKELTEGKAAPILTEVKPIKNEEPVARSAGNTGEVRTKKTRLEK